MVEDKTRLSPVPCVQDVFDAVKFCMHVQYRLLEVPWSRAVLKLPSCKVQWQPQCVLFSLCVFSRQGPVVDGRLVCQFCRLSTAPADRSCSRALVCGWASTGRRRARSISGCTRSPSTASLPDPDGALPRRSVTRPVAGRSGGQPPV